MLTQARLKELFHYDPDTGIFIFLRHRYASKIGTQAGNFDDGYLKIKIDGKSYLLHRLAYLYVTGNFPTKNLDHKDLNRSNNAFLNLRPSEQYQNTCNVRRYSNNTSSVKGVSWHKQNSKWTAYIYYKRKRHYLGTFKLLEDAENAVRAKREELHGEFANHG